MTALENAALRQLAAQVVTRRAGPGADASALVAAARSASDELAGVLAPLIGRIGVDALAARALHLVKLEYPWLAETRDPEPPEALISHISGSLERQDPATATAAAAAVLATFTGLLIKLIGEPLAATLMRQAWPDGFSDARAKETGA
jgi:hypothetical protein